MFITLYRVGKRDRVHYYTIHNRQGNLFTPWSLTISWGPSMETGRERLVIMETRAEFDQQVRRLLARRFKEGYQVLYSYFRQDERRYLRSPRNSGRLASSI